MSEQFIIGDVCNNPNVVSKKCSCGIEDWHCSNCGEGSNHSTCLSKTKSITTPIINPKKDDDFVNAVRDIYGEAHDILLSKHNDYGPTNISNAPGGALNGLRVRIHDKTARINNLIDSGKDPQHESLRDSFLDLMNYAAIALLVIDGDWPGVEAPERLADCD